MDVLQRQVLLDKTIRAAAEEGYYVIARAEFQATLGKVTSAGERALSRGLWGAVFGARVLRVLVTVREDGEVIRQTF
jgi:hypothetical protein